MAERGPKCSKCGNDFWEREGGYGDVPRSRVCTNCGKEVVLRSKPIRRVIPTLSMTDIKDLGKAGVAGVASYLMVQLSLTPAQVRAVESILYGAIDTGDRRDGIVDIDRIEVQPMYHPGSFAIGLSGIAAVSARHKPGRFYVEYRGHFMVGVNGAIEGITSKESGRRALIYEWDYFGKKR